MILALDAWLIPAIAAASSSYLVSLLWERLRPRTAPTRLQEAFLAVLSFLMGGICALYRVSAYERSLESNTIVMFLTAAVTTFAWLCLRRHFPGLRQGR
jgi:hypothetical protein